MNDSQKQQYGTRPAGIPSAPMFHHPDQSGSVATKACLPIVRDQAQTLYAQACEITDMLQTLERICHKLRGPDRALLPPPNDRAEVAPAELSVSTILGNSFEQNSRNTDAFRSMLTHLQESV